MTTVRAVLQLRRGEPGLEAARATSRSILFWGIMSLLLGALGTVVGLVLMADAVHRAGGAGAGLVWGGIGLSLVTLIFGLLTLLFSGLAWLGVRRWSKRWAATAES